MTSIELPWPPKELSANSRKDRRYTGQHRKNYRASCWALCKASKPDPALTHLDITFHPPDARRRDLDNMLSGIKYGLDGVAQALGVDDYEWSMSIKRGEPCRPAGKVVIEFRHPDIVSLPVRGTIS